MKTAQSLSPRHSIAFAAALTTALWLAAPAVQAAPTGGLTREEVMAEYWRARAAGELPAPSQLYGPLLSQALAESMGGRHRGDGR